MNPLKRESRETFDAFVNIPIFIIFQLRRRNFSFHHLSTLALIADLSKHMCAPPLFSYGTDSKIGITLTSKKYFKVKRSDSFNIGMDIVRGIQKMVFCYMLSCRHLKKDV